MRTHRAIAVSASSLLLAGCYVMQPVGSPAAVEGKHVAFDITDAGRVALGGAMGPSIANIEGRFLRRENDEYVVAVTSVRYLAGGTQTWAGEPVRLKPEYVATTYERRLSKSRTVAVSAAGVGIIAAIVTRSITTGPGSPTIPPDPGPGGTTSRSPRP